MQEEEAGEVEAVDEVDLLVGAPQCGGAVAVAVGIAVLQPGGAQLGQAARRRGVLRAGVAVAEVLAEIEVELLRETCGLGHRVGVVAEARGHGLRGGEHVGVVAAAQGLGGVERRVLADGHEGVLEQGAVAVVRVDVAGGHGGHAETLRERFQRPVAAAVVAQVGALQLDPQAVGAEGLAQAAQAAQVVHAAGRAAGQADEPIGVVEHLLERDPRRLPDRAALGRTRLGVREGQQPAQAGPARGRSPPAG